MTQPVEPIVLPPIEAFLIRPQFAPSDLWVWPLFVAVAYFWLRSMHKTVGLKGRDVDVLVALKALNSLILWGTIIALSRAVHRVTDDVIVAGVWSGVTLALGTGAYRAIVRYGGLAETDARTKAAFMRYSAEQKALDKAKKEAKARGETFVDPRAPEPRPAQPRPEIYVGRDTPQDARRQVEVLMRKDLFAEPPPGEAAPGPEKPPVG